MARDLEQLKNDLALRIRALRIERGLTQEKLALEADVDRTYVSQVERSIGNPSLTVLAKIAAVLGVDVVDLFEAGVKMHYAARAKPRPTEF